MAKIMTFTGGLGAQLISAAGYFHLQKRNEPVLADFSYFRGAYHEAQPGNRGEISHWKWELDTYGLNFSDFVQRTTENGNPIWDGLEKAQLGFAGLADPDIQKKFPVPAEMQQERAKLFGEETYACVHIRRGDYLNVASFLIDDDTFFRAIVKIRRLVKNILVVSDTPLSERLTAGLKALDAKVMTAIGGSPAAIHSLMRMSDIFIGSNSQFSMTAAALREPDTLVIYPSQHDATMNSDANTYLHSIREWQVITRF